jgi:hypothetical protein
LSKVLALRLVLYGRKKKSHFAGKMDFLAERKKSYYTEKSHLTKVILSTKWFSPQKVTFFPYNMEKKNLFDIKNGFDAKWFFFPFDIKNGFDAK